MPFSRGVDALPDGAPIAPIRKILSRNGAHSNIVNNRRVDSHNFESLLWRDSNSAEWSDSRGET